MKCIRDQAEEYWRDDLEVIESGIPKLNIVEPIVAGEETRWVQTDKIPYRDANGDIIGIIGFALDITKRKQAEEELTRHRDHLEELVAERTAELQQEITERQKAEIALREGEERFRTQMVQSPLVMEIYNLEGLQIEVNTAYEQLWGFPASTTVNKFNVLKSKEVKETGLMNYVEQAYAGEAVTVPEYVFDPTGETESGGPGRIRWLSTKIYPLKDSAGNVKDIVITHEDITDRRRAQEALHASEEKFRLLAEKSVMGIYIIEGGEMTYVNPSFAHVFGYEPTEIVGHLRVVDLIHPDDRELVSKNLQDRQAGRMPGDNIAYQGLKKDGTTIYIEVHSTPIDSSDPSSFMGTLLDVTERRLAAEELTAANNELEIERTLLKYKNVALRELMEQIDQQKQQTNKQLQANVTRVALPMLQIISDKLGPGDQHLVKLLESSLADLTDPTTSKLEQLHSNLSPRELEVCNMIRRGFSSKQMASILSVSVHTVNNQHRSIRKKLAINDNRTNLETYLKSL